MSELIFDNVSKSYGEKKVLSGFSHTFKPGFNIISGRSGCGKTTLLRLASGLEKADGGKIAGVGKWAFMFQEQRLLESRSALENMMLFFGKEVKNEAVSVLSSLGLGENDIIKPVSELSGGMAQRVSLARFVLYVKRENLDTVFLDEPFRGLDAETKKTVLSVLVPLIKDKTVLLISHDPSDLELLPSPIPFEMS